MKKIKKVLISVYDKSYLSNLVSTFKKYEVEIISTGGTKKAIESLGANVTSVESLTKYPSILGGRVKTLHPNIFGGILTRTDNQSDQKDMDQFNIDTIDMVIVDLYPFQEAVEQNADESEIIEKIDIGGVSLIRAAAKNYKDILIVSSTEHFDLANNIIIENDCCTNIKQRLSFAQKAFNVTSNYEYNIATYFNSTNKENSKTPNIFRQNILSSKKLRYGENPHQDGVYYGELNKLFDQLNGKELSYNNLLDIDAAVNLIEEFEEPSFGILKHNNACGFASNKNIEHAWDQALAGDPISAFGGVLITNNNIDLKIASKINTLFFEVLIAEDFSNEALDLLKSKKSRIILKKKNANLGKISFRSVLNGVLLQTKDLITDGKSLQLMSNLEVNATQMSDLIFASKICKHTKSNTIVLAKNKQLLASGCGQTSRVDALKQAIIKAKHFGFSLQGAVMASDAFFHFQIVLKLLIKKVFVQLFNPVDQKMINYLLIIAITIIWL